MRKTIKGVNKYDKIINRQDWFVHMYIILREAYVLILI